MAALSALLWSPRSLIPTSPRWSATTAVDETPKAVADAPRCSLAWSLRSQRGRTSAQSPLCETSRSPVTSGGWSRSASTCPNEPGATKRLVVRLGSWAEAHLDNDPQAARYHLPLNEWDDPREV